MGLTNTPSDLLPGTLELLILKALRPGAKRGYGIVEHLRVVSDDVLRIGALALAAMGIYGVIRYSVMQRMPELGIRMALGASTHAIGRMVIAESLRMAAIGSMFGVLGSLVLSRLLDGVLYGSRAADPLIILAVGCGLVVLAVAAASGPARRAFRSDPMQAVRAD